MIEVNLYNAFKAMSFDVDLDPFTRRYCLKRIRFEGYKFLTVTLPSLSKAVLRSLELGYFERPLGFQWKGKSLAIFSRFLNKIFDRKTGAVLENVDPLAVYSLRQVCEYCYKLALPFDEAQVSEYTDNFVETDLSVPDSEYDYAYVDQLRKDFETFFPQLARATVDDILSKYRPRSGPGTFSGAEPGWYMRKEFDYDVDPSFAHLAWASRPTRSSPMPRVASDPSVAELLFVPKDSRGPRVIIREPYSRLRYQLAFNSFLAKGLEKATRNRVNFQDQQVNRRLAESSSSAGDYATLDLKEASDRVSYTIMKHIFRNSPGLLHFLLRRTTHVVLPNGNLHYMRKLSGMGSGYTFPSMSLLIYLTVVRTISTRTGIPYKEVSRDVYVYGDDLIVRGRFVASAADALQRVGLMLNTEKSYYRGRFRESCGGDYYDGQDVTPIRLRLSGSKFRQASTSSKTSKICSPAFSNAVVQLERHARECVRAGLLHLSESYYRILERHLGRLPDVAGDSPVLGRYSILPLECPTDETGAYKNKRVLVPFPVTKRFTKRKLGVYRSEDAEQRYAYTFLARSLKRERTWLDALYPNAGSAYGEVDVPRKIRLARCSVSGFRLMG